jgi:purine catabolism regulator
VPSAWRSRRRALDLLLHGAPDTASLLLESVDAAAVPPGPLRVLRVRGPGDTLEDLLADLETEPVLAARVGDELVVVSADRRAGGTGQRLVAGGARVGVGPSVAVADLAHSHDGAEHALTALPDAPVAAWDDLMRGGVLALLGTGASAYADEFLAPLGDDPALLATLGAYLDHHGSVGETAAALAVHRNTVRNRLRQVEAALGRSLDDPHVRVDAWVAVQALRTR